MKSILGQKRAVRTLQSAVESGRLHHAWIFSGPKGVGKFTTAVELARILLDSEKNENPQSRIQSLIDAGTHPDLHIIRKELALFSDNQKLRERKLMTIPLDLLRERMLGGTTGDDRSHEAAAFRTAALGHGKVFIIDEAELLAREAQNVMLKTLEEPPPQTFFFLITSQPERLFSTIHSRCQHVRFGSLDHDSMQAWFDKAQCTLDAKTQAWVEAFADGSPGLAQLAIEYNFHEWQNTLPSMLVQVARGDFPSTMGATLGKLAEEFAIMWVKKNKNASKDAANKDGMRHLLTFLTQYTRRQLSETCTGNGDSSRWLAWIENIREAERQVFSNVNMKLVLENLVVQCAEANSPACA